MIHIIEENRKTQSVTMERLMDIIADLKPGHYDIEISKQAYPSCRGEKYQGTPQYFSLRV